MVDPAMGLGTIGTLGLENLEVRTGTSDRGCVQEDGESSWVSWNAVRAFAGCRFTVERVR